MSDLVKVQVVETDRTGVTAKILEDGRAGFIRRQELSWDQRVDSVPRFPEVEERLEAKILPSKDTRYVRLSLRLGDPWEDQKVEEEFHEGQVVQGQVVQLSRFGAFVQLVPGVNALARPNTIPLLRNQPLEDALAVGDEIQAVITEIDPSTKGIKIHLTKWLRQLSGMSAEERRSFQLDLFKDIPIATEQPSQIAAEQDIENVEEREETGPSNPLVALVRRILARERWERARGGGDVAALATGLNVSEEQLPKARFSRRHPSLKRLERVLVIDDTAVDRREIGRRIEEALNCHVDCVEFGTEALEKADGGNAYDLVLIDVNLQEENPIKIAEGLQAAQPQQVIVFMSHDPEADAKLPGDAAFVLKDQGFASLLQYTEQMCQGTGKQAGEEGEETALSKGDFVHHLGMEAFARRTLEETLQPMLHRLRLQTQVTQAIVFKVNSEEKEVSVVTADPELEENAQRVLLDRLYYSPIQNIVEDEEPYYETNTAVRYRHPRFRRLYRILPFRSCLGLPLTIPDLETQHVLFLFDEKRPRFELEDLDNARLAAQFLQVALERATFFEFMRRYEERYSRGLLVGSLMHELAIKLNTLGSLVDTLSTVLSRATDASKVSERQKWLQKATEIAADLDENKQELRDLADAYLQIARENWEPVYVNDVVEKVKLQMEKLAAETEVAIHIDAGDLPPARAISSRLEQILLNLVLNAIQQIGRQQEMMAKLAGQTGDDFALLQKGQVIIQTRYLEADPSFSVQILVIDTGPGISYPDQKRIFRLDTTTREEGHGWGLFISRNLVEIMRGRLRLVNSVRFVGSVFAVELPSFSSRGGA